jgi:hypothetical protein
MEGSAMANTIASGISFCGQLLRPDDLALIRQITSEYPSLSQTELALTICELLDWRRPNGGLKSRECVEFLQQLREQAVVSSLPALRPQTPRGPRVIKVDAASDPQSPLSGPLARYLPLQLCLVETPEQGHLFRQFLHRYHYLGFKVPFGASLRYFVQSRNPPHPLLACLLFKSAGWRMAPRDEWIGWTSQARQANLQRVVNNSRFLIFPWVEIPNLASHLLSLAARQIVGDWERMYNARPVLLETLVDRTRYAGTCYHAANWICVGATQGRGRMDRFHQSPTTRKDILLYPLARNWRQVLRQNTTISGGNLDDHARDL